MDEYIPKISEHLFLCSIADSDRVFQVFRCNGCNIASGTKHRCYILFNPYRPDSLPRCLRCEKKKKGCSLSAYEPRTNTNSTKKAMSSEEGYRLSLLTQLVAKSQKAAHKVLPKNPVHAVQMLRGCYEGQDEHAEVASSPAESDYEDYRDVPVDSGCEWSQDEAFNAGMREQVQLPQDVAMADGTVSAHDAQDPFGAVETFGAEAPQQKAIDAVALVANETPSGALESPNAEALQDAPMNSDVLMADHTVSARDARNPIGALVIFHLRGRFFDSTSSLIPSGFAQSTGYGRTCQSKRADIISATVEASGEAGSGTATDGGCRRSSTPNGRETLRDLLHGPW